MISLAHFEGAAENPWPGPSTIRIPEPAKSLDIWRAELMGVTGSPTVLTNKTDALGVTDSKPGKY